MMRARRAAFAAAAALAAAGCMTGARTMEQDLAFQRWKRCDTFATIVLQRIDTDGRVIVTGRTAEQTPFLKCMAEQAREQQKSKPGLVVPDPIVNPIPR
jgi:hypothetical protein